MTSTRDPPGLCPTPCNSERVDDNISDIVTNIIYYPPRLCLTTQVYKTLIISEILKTPPRFIYGIYIFENSVTFTGQPLVITKGFQFIYSLDILD